MPKPYEHNLISSARRLRAEATRQERHLWRNFLSSYQPRFQRQKPIGSYILDFYCFRASLGIEIDGSQHYDDEAKSYDELRSKILSDKGITVLRFSNADIDGNFEGVCAVIDSKVKSLLNESAANPTPSRGGQNA